MFRKISFGELQISEEGKENVQKVLNSNWVSSGPMVEKFEQEWSKLFGYKHSIAVGNGTDACIAMFMSLYDFGWTRGDEIICPACTFVATANSILAAGFTPVFVDVNPVDLNITVDSIKKKLTSKTAAVVCANLMGIPGPMNELRDFCYNNELFLFEDNCEAHGAAHRGTLVGKFGAASAFSCYAAHLIVCGEGGMVCTSEDEVADIVKSIRSHGRRGGSLYFDFERMGLNLKMNDLEAAIGLDQIKDFKTTFAKRKMNYCKLCAMLQDLVDERKISIFKERDFEVISPHAFPILCSSKKDAEGLYKYLEDHGIQCKTLFGSLPTQHSAFSFLGHSYGEFPNAERIGDIGLHFGIHQYLTDEDLEYIALKIKKFFRSE